MKIIAALLVVVALVAAASAASFFDNIRAEWRGFKLAFNRSYSNPFEEQYRFRIYTLNKLAIAEHNHLYELGIVSYKVNVNVFADMMHDEFLQTMTGTNLTFTLSKLFGSSSQQDSDSPTIMAEQGSIPDEVDWRQKGAVTPVKHQGSCGSCWAFATTGALEGQHFRKTGELVSLSEQNLVDCSKKDGGCQGGFMTNSYDYIKNNGGIEKDATYPYEARASTCRYNANNRGAVCTGYVSIQRGNENKMKEAVANNGPLAVAIDAGQSSFQFYSDGVYYEEKCSSSTVNHGMLVVGYGTDKNGGDYWLVKNSWGTSWGIGGYMKLARNRSNHCAIANWASYPRV